MTPEISSRISRGFVRLQNKNGSPAGCGFLISTNYICTCAHVVNKALGLDLTAQELPQDPIKVDFPFLAAAQMISTKILPDFWSPLSSQKTIENPNHRDLALLEVKSPLPKGARPLPLSTTLEFIEHPFCLYGYPREEPTGTWAVGDRFHPDEKGLIRIEAKKQTSCFVQSGFSGAPVWDKSIGRVIGMVSPAYPKGKSPWPLLRRFQR